MRREVKKEVSVEGLRGGEKGCEVRGESAREGVDGEGSARSCLYDPALSGLDGWKIG